MTENDTSLLNLVNASGFLFQLRIDHEIEKTKSSREGRWEVIAREHRWLDPLDGKEGFIDLVLDSGIARMVIECKRTTEASWVFLITKGQPQTRRSRLLWTYEGPIPKETYRKKLYEWHDFNAKLLSFESTFCIVRGQGEKDAPMLERLSSLLLRSVEGIANEELGFSDKSVGDLHLYAPVIITNTKLYICQYEPDDIDLFMGQLGKADFVEIPFVRFRKNLSSSTPDHKQSDLQKANLYNERTVFVVNSTSIREFLADLDFPYKINVPWPWEGLRQS